jgi:hypothetical protein
VLSTVKPTSAGSGAEYIASAAGVAAIGAAFFAMEAAFSARLALFASLALFEPSIVARAGFLSWMRRAAR